MRTVQYRTGLYYTVLYAMEPAMQYSKHSMKKKKTKTALHVLSFVCPSDQKSLETFYKTLLETLSTEGESGALTQPLLHP